MARCRCANEECSCTLRAGVGVTVSGDGTTAAPYVISAAAPSVTGTIQFANTTEVAFVTTGAGTVASPYVVRAGLPWVNPDMGSTGMVLTRQADGTWAPGPPNTVDPGLISVGQGVTGDGSASSPLRLDVCTYDELFAACVP